MNKFWELIQELIELGVIIELYKSKDKTIADLNTGMKSHCYLVEHNNTITAEMRYDKIVVINNLDDILIAVKSCMHGQTYLSMSWSEVFENTGY